MLAAFIDRFDAKNPASTLTVGDRPDPAERDGWVRVRVRAASVNHHDVFTARGGVIPAAALPRILGMDAAGIDQQGREVVVHNLVNAAGWSGPPLLDPGLTGLSEGYDGTFAEEVLVPSVNLVAKPPSLSFEQAACLPTAWLTAYRMLFIEGQAHPGDTVLVQGSTGGVATALLALGRAGGIRMWATGRTAEKRALAEQIGAERTFTSGERLPHPVDAVMETVGAATWDHSLRSSARGGRIVVAGGTSGYEAGTNLARVFTKNLRIIGSTMGTLADLERLVTFLDGTGVRPVIGEVLTLRDAARALRMLDEGTVFGKIVLTT